MLKEDERDPGLIAADSGPTRAAGAAADDAWRWSLNWSEIRSDLLIGSCPMGLDDIERILGETKASAILS
jgi:hypothetical protein